jgi:hypothetical protein
MRVGMCAPLAGGKRVGACARRTHVPRPAVSGSAPGRNDGGKNVFPAARPAPSLVSLVPSSSLDIERAYRRRPETQPTRKRRRTVQWSLRQRARETKLMRMRAWYTANLTTRRLRRRSRFSYRRTLETRKNREDGGRDTITSHSSVWTYIAAAALIRFGTIRKIVIRFLEKREIMSCETS